MADADPGWNPRSLAARSGPIAELANLMSELFLLQGRFTSIFGGIREMANMSPVETLTLSAVISAKRPVTVPQIGRSLGHARQVVQRAANALERRGYLATQSNPGHKRAAFLVSTPAGLELQREFDVVADEILAILAADLDPAQVRSTHQGLIELRKVMEQRDRAIREQAARPAE